MDSTIRGDKRADKGFITIRPSGGLPPDRPIGRPGIGHPRGVFGVFSNSINLKYYLLTWSA
jgi:hypothetical protein